MSRFDLSDLCFVDDLVSLLIFWRKSQLSGFAEMVSQVLESGRLRVNKSKLEVLIGDAGPGARRINAELAGGAYQFTLRGEGHQGPSSIFSWTVRLWLTLVRSILPFAAEAHAWLPRDVETLDKWQNRALRHIARSAVHVSRERTQDLRKRLGVHTVVSTMQVRRVTLGCEKEHVQRRSGQRWCLDDCRLKRGRHRRLDSSISS